MSELPQVEHPPFYSSRIHPPPGELHHFEEIGYAVAVDKFDGVSIKVLDLVRKKSSRMHTRSLIEIIPLAEAARLPSAVKVGLRREIERLKAAGQWPEGLEVPVEITATGG
ncbi:hypothetical protein [Afipia clevelandensis]|uniref:Uncharacterized protein n=1 Tax=Afipia clevelandensis ATCC 49720 TaxID=883079 RepID=K8PLN2_9BRAD|nr:hypothetical protein [Afipia clevelandensis]EKS40410.1 hypothetical protein HMPREF9696_00861 [Afipia clevelandensis ATCC 49720]